MTDVKQSVQDLGVPGAQPARGQETLGKLMAPDDALYVRCRRRSTTWPWRRATPQEITDGLRAGEGTLGKALVDSALYEQSLDTLRTANRAAQSVEDQAPISILGTIVTSLF